MFSFMASQAIALSQVKKRDPNKLPESVDQNLAPSTGGGFWFRLGRRMLHLRRRRAGIELPSGRDLHEKTDK
jgi:hypothetical protein